MLVIRQEQLEALARQDLIDFERRMTVWLTEEYPDVFPPDQQAARTLVASALKKGEEYGVRTRGGLTALVSLMAEYGEKFELSPDARWARGILAHRTLPGDLKISMIATRFESRTQGRKIVRIRAGESA